MAVLLQVLQFQFLPLAPLLAVVVEIAGDRSVKTGLSLPGIQMTFRSGD